MNLHSKFCTNHSIQDETAGASTSIPGSGEGKVRGWQKEPLSIMWCLNSFDSESSSQSRNVLYDKKTQTVMAVENPAPGQSSSAGNSQQTSSKTKGIYINDYVLQHSSLSVHPL